jgi:transcriptional regulator with XRE-family HTH domain
MRIIDYLDALNWSQTRLSQEAKVSVSTVQRVVQAKPISRLNAEKICEALSRGLQIPVEPHDINEIHVTRAERPERRKHKEEEEQPREEAPQEEQPPKKKGLFRT